MGDVMVGMIDRRLINLVTGAQTPPLHERVSASLFLLHQRRRRPEQVLAARFFLSSPVVVV